MNICFSAALLIFGYSWGYRTREISARDHVKAVKVARDVYGLSEEQVAAYEQRKAARLAGLAKARLVRAQNFLREPGVEEAKLSAKHLPRSR